MGIEKLLFSFQGRIDRLTWWVAQIGLGILFAVVFFVFKMSLGTIPAVLSVFPLYWSTTALNVKRLHDRGKSGWWLLALGAAGALTSWSGLLVPYAKADPSLASVVLGLAGIAILIGLWSLWIMIQMMFFVGSPGPNKYGQPPMLLIELFGTEPVAPPPVSSGHTSVPRAEVAVGPVRAGGGLPRRPQATVAPSRAAHPGGPNVPQGFGKRR